MGWQCRRKAWGHLAGKDMLRGGVGGVQEEEVDAAAAQRWVLPHARMPAHVARVQDVLCAVQTRAVASVLCP